MFPLRDSVRSRRIPIVNNIIIVINILVFFLELKQLQSRQLESFIMQWGLVPARFFEAPLAQWLNIFTSMFLHGGWAHLIGNMWFLFIFGDNVEDAMGHIRYVFYYLLMGIGAASLQLTANKTGALPMVGASGAIAGILGSYFVLYPAARVLTAVWFFFFLRFIEIPAFFFLGIWFVMQMINGLGALSIQAVRGEVGGVAWWAHAGGFISGFLMIWFFKRPRTEQW